MEIWNLEKIPSKNLENPEKNIPKKTKIPSENLENLENPEKSRVKTSKIPKKTKNPEKIPS